MSPSRSLAVRYLAQALRLNKDQKMRFSCIYWMDRLRGFRTRLGGTVVFETVRTTTNELRRLKNGTNLINHRAVSVYKHCN
jgi:hypothetical protein